MPTVSDKDLLQRVRERYKVMTDADSDNRHRAMDDLKFLHNPGEQWDQIIRSERGTRPCYEFNKLRIKVKRIVNEMRANRPQGKVRAVEDSDKDTADIYEGLCRNIDNVSDMDTICDYAGEYQVGAGMGAWRVVTDYLDEDSFVQDIRAEAIKNPFCLYGDPAAQDPFKRDGRDWILTQRLSKAAFEEQYPEADVVDFDDQQFDDQDDWEDGETVRICEYWYKEPYDKEIWLLADGKAIAKNDPAAKLISPEMIQQKRISKCNRIMQCIVSGNAVLKKPSVQAGKRHRFVMVPGEWVVVDGKVHWFGLTRQAKDAQRSYNVSRTAVTETIASAPQSKWWATAEQAKGHTDKWNQAIAENLPYLLYNSDPKISGPPTRMGGADVPVALIQELTLADQELKDVTGVYDASLGERSNEKSGVAISRRTEQTQIVNFNYPDNMAKGRKITWEIYVDLIPEIYDSERVVRILGRDLGEKYLKINQAVIDPQTGQAVVLNDLSNGKYDVTVTTGPSFSTQRQEASEAYGQMAQAFPQLMGVAGDLIFKAQDLPYSDEIADRMRTLLPPQIQQTLNQDKPPPPEVQQAMAQVQTAMQQVQQQGQMVQAAAAEATTMKTEAEKAVSNLKVQQAQFEADVAKELAKVDLAKANLALSAAKAEAAGIQTDSAANQAAFQTLMAQTVAEIQQMGASFMQAASQTMADIQAKQQPQVIVHSPPKRKIVHVKRVDGALVGEMTEVPDLLPTMQ